MGKDKLSVAYRRDCARAEEEALQTLRSVHMPVINIPSMRGITLANYRRRMVKCDGKMRENDIVLVATTDFVAASLACPMLFGWTVDDNNDQISALLADLDRRWTRLLSTDAPRRDALIALLESSLRCLDDRHAAHFAGARRAGSNPVKSPQAVSSIDQSQRSSNDGLDQSHRSVSTDLSERPVRNVPSEPTPPPTTLHTFFKPRAAKPVAIGDDPARDVVWIGDAAPKVFAARQGKMLVFAPSRNEPAQTQNERGTDLTPTDMQTVRLTNRGSPPLSLTNQCEPSLGLANQDLLPQNSTNQGQQPQTLTNQSVIPQNLLANQGPPQLIFTNHGLVRQTPTNQSSLPLVNATNVAKPSAAAVKPPANALLALMSAAKENQRKRAAAVRTGANKVARKGR